MQKEDRVDADVEQRLRRIPLHAQYFVTTTSKGRGIRLVEWANRHREELAASFTRILRHLLEGMILYQDAGIVHNAINPANIRIFDNGLARIDGFSSAFRIGDVGDFRTIKDGPFGKEFQPDFLWDPPEIHVWHMLADRIRVNAGIQTMKTKRVEYDRMTLQFPTREPLEDAMLRFANTSSDIRRNDFKAFLRRHATKIDSWGLGVCMWELWNSLLVWSDFPHTEAWADRALLRRVLNGLTEFDVEKRWTAREALSALEPMSRMAAAAALSTPTSPTTSG